jgi:ABC-type glycerol-3-phosphate transport system substrate-binding protein
MVEIEFSVMVAAHADADNLLPILEAFEKQYHIRVKLIGITWFEGWTEIAKFGIYGHGPDVSCIGTSWIGSLAAMQVLRPFTPQEVRSLGGAEAFFEPSWQTCFLPDDPSPWAIPWIGDPMVFYYWKDVLEKAGVHDFDAAFATDESIVETLKELQKSGIAHPLALTTGYNTVNLHEAAHWLWNAGGDFISADHRRVIFNQPAAMQGLRNYFSLKPFISPKASTMQYPGDLFNAGESPIHLGGLWHGMTGRERNPEWDKRLGVAQIPGTSYVGGGNFVIWKYSLYYREAFELVRFLSSQPTRIPVSPHTPVNMPTRRDAIHIPSVENDIFHRTYVLAMQSGKSFPSTRLWGSIESKLVTEITNIWAELFANPDQDLDTCLHRHLDPLAERLNIVLGD